MEPAPGADPATLAAMKPHVNNEDPGAATTEAATELALATTDVAISAYAARVARGGGSSLNWD
eukprot:3736567-Amphidinium_carterae.1